MLTTLGREMSAYAEALSRDRWRLAKCEERLRVVNLGGTAIGTGIAAPRDYIFRVVDVLRDVTGIGLARAENLVDATQNADVFVEVSGLLKALASTLIKIASDLRLMSSGPGSRPRRNPPPRAPGWVEHHARQGQPGHPRSGDTGRAPVHQSRPGLDHGRFDGQPGTQRLPALSSRTPCCESFDLLASASHILRTHCVEGLEADEARCRRHVENATASATALLPLLGYERAAELVERTRASGRGLKEDRGGRRIRDSRRNSTN